MAKSTLKLVGVYEAWSRNVRQGRLTRANGTESAVLVRVQDTSATPELLARLKDDTRLYARLQHENVLRIEHVSAVGGKIAQVHEGFDGASAARVLHVLRARNQVLPARAAVETAAAVGLALDEALRIVDGERRLIHPGAGPEEVLVDVSGHVKVAGFVVRQPADAPLVIPRGYVAPERGDGPAAATYAVGALLIELLSGDAPPDAAPEPDRHEAAVRRALIRVLARPGDTPGEAVVQALRQALAHDPNARGAPGAFGRRLRELAVSLQSPGLRAWAPGSIHSIQKFSQAPAPTADAPAPTPVSALPPPVDDSVARGLAMKAGMTIAPPADAGPPSPLPDEASRSFPRPAAGQTIVPDADGPPGPPPSRGAPAPQPSRGPPPPPPSRGPRFLEPPATPPDPTRSAAMPRQGPLLGGAAGPPRVDAPPTVPVPSSRPAALPPPGVTLAPAAVGPALLLAAESDEVEATVVAMVRQPEEAPAAPPVDPLGPSGPALGPAGPGFGPAGPSIGGGVGASGPSVGPSLTGDRGHPGDRPAPRSVLDEEPEAAPKRGWLGFVVAAVLLLGLIAVAGVVAVVALTGDDPAEEAVAPAAPPATLADVAAEPAAEPAATPEPAVATPEPAVATPAPVAEPAPTPAATPAPAPAAAPKAAAPAPAAPKAAPSATTTRASSRAATPEAAEEPVRIAPAAPAPAPVVAAPAPTPAPVAADPSATYRVSFASADPSVTSIEVKCKVGSGTGSGMVSLDGVPAGNCRVTGRGGASPVIAMVTITADREYTCFAGGARSCQ